MKIGVMVMPIPLARGETEHVVGYAAARAFAQQAEAAGFDSIWLFDHLLLRYPDKPTEGVWEVWTFLSALAEATTRVELGTLVMCTPFRNPALLAKMAVTLDEVSGGRVILGLGVGWHQPEFDAFGIPFDAKVDRFEEALQIIVPLIREGRVSFAGTQYRADDCEILPRGPRPNGPPILIASFGPRMLRLTARYADYWNTAWFGHVSTLITRHGDLMAACAAEGRDPATLAVTVGMRVHYIPPNGDTSPPSDPDRVVAGSPEKIAALLHDFAAAGVAHVICSLTPSTAEALSHLTAALAIYRQTAT